MCLNSSYIGYDRSTKSDRLLDQVIRAMNEPGTLEWIDLTVEDAEHVRDFYADIVGWTPEPVSMGEYDDYNMVTAGEPVAGVCHARGSNAALPPVWLPYFRVSNLEQSLARCLKRGGQVVAGPRSAGPGMQYGVIRDPAGAAAALFENEEA